MTFEDRADQLNKIPAHLRGARYAVEDYEFFYYLLLEKNLHCKKPGASPLTLFKGSYEECLEFCAVSSAGHLSMSTVDGSYYYFKEEYQA